jgi:predicted nucleotidyltransferase component of viral defense system
VLDRDYCLAWFLVGLSRSSLREHLVFKGGTALKRCYFGDYRFSEDLDFTLASEISLESILSGLEDIYADVRSASGIPFHYSREDRKKHQNNHTFYLAYEGPLPAVSPKEVKVDITIRERFVLPIEERAVLRGYDEYADLTEDNKIRVYSLDEIGVEKVVALTDRARNEPRDLYDVWYLTSEEHVDLAMLMPEIDSKLEFRGRSRDAMGEEFKKREARYKKLWSPRLGSQMAELPPFDDVFRSVRRSLRAAELIPRT